MNPIFSEHFSDAPYWLDPVSEPGAAAAAAPMAELPASVDVLVVGGGLTGSSAAGELARAGRLVLVVDAGEPGAGASSRNAGMLGRNTKHSFLGLKASHGLEAAVVYFRELRQVFDQTREFIRQEAIPCGLREGGRLVTAYSRPSLERLLAEYDAREKHLGEPYRRITAQELTASTGLQGHAGAVFVEDNVTLHPGAYTQAIIQRARRAGALYAAHTTAGSIRRSGQGFEVRTSRGVVAAREVVIATNGYTGRLVPWLANRIVQIQSYILATEPMSPQQAGTILKDFRHGIDNTRRPMSLRLSPDGSRVLFGARTAEPRRRGIRAIAADMYADMLGVLPGLRGIRISHAWEGRCAVTWDMFPHLGVQDGLYYALGLCFSGLATAPHLGRKVAARMLGAPSFGTSYADRRFPRIPWPARAFDHEASRWLVRYYGYRDHPGASRADG